MTKLPGTVLNCMLIPGSSRTQQTHDLIRKVSFYGIPGFLLFQLLNEPVCLETNLRKGVEASGRSWISLFELLQCKLEDHSATRH